jgi:hypothetical protein
MLAYSYSRRNLFDDPVAIVWNAQLASQPTALAAQALAFCAAIVKEGGARNESRRGLLDGSLEQ